MRECSVCKLEQPKSEFYREPLRKDGLSKTCKGCVKKRSARWAAENPEKARAAKVRYAQKKGKPTLPSKPRSSEDARRRRMKRVYGVTDEQIDSLTSCELCGAENDLVWDHDHDTGVTRGRLCRNCNTALARLGDRVAPIEKVLSYLKRNGLVA